MHFLRVNSLIAVDVASLWVVTHPQPLELDNKGLQEVPLLSDDDVLKVALHCCRCPVEGACDESTSIYQDKLVMHVHGARVAAHADPCGADRNMSEMKVGFIGDAFLSS